MHAGTVLSVACVVAVVLGTKATWCQVPELSQQAEARIRFERGLALFNARDYDGALAEFQAAYELSRRPAILYNIGVAHQQLQHYPEAAQAIERYLREATLTPERRAQVERGLAEIRHFIGYVTLTGLPSGALVRLDGETVTSSMLSGPLPVGCGLHTLDVTAPGFRDVRETFLIAGHQEREIRVEMEPSVLTTTTPVDRSVSGAPMGSVLVQGVPRHATVEIDGSVVPVGRPVRLLPGMHRVRIRAEGYVPWDGQVDVPEGVHRVVDVRLAERGRMGPAWFFVSAGATAALGTSAVIMGANTLATRAAFERLVREDPRAQQLADTGSTQRLITNVLLGATAVGVVITSVLFLRTDFGARRTRVDVAVAPRPEGGAEGAVGVRF